MAAHGAQKLFGWFSGHGLVGTGAFLESLGFRPDRRLAAMAALTEFASGMLVAVGFLGLIGPALMISVMIVAAITVHWKNGVFATANGIELPLLFAGGAFAPALISPAWWP
jgi:putative oxidoreductase